MARSVSSRLNKPGSFKKLTLGSEASKAAWVQIMSAKRGGLCASTRLWWRIGVCKREGSMEYSAAQRWRTKWKLPLLVSELFQTWACSAKLLNKACASNLWLVCLFVCFPVVLYVWVFCLAVCQCTMWVTGSCRGGKKASGPLDVEL